MRNLSDLMTFKTVVINFLHAAEFVHMMNIMISAYRTTILVGGMHFMPLSPTFVS